MPEDVESQEPKEQDADEAPSPSPSPLRIGELLLRRALITQNDLALALSEQEFNSGSAPIGRLLVRLGAIDETVLTATLAEQAGMHVVTLDPESMDPSAIDRLPREAAFRLRALPLRYQDGRLLVALAEPPTRELRREILKLSARPCDFVLADTQELSDVIERCYPHPASACNGESQVAKDSWIDVAPPQSPSLHFRPDGGMGLSSAKSPQLDSDIDTTPRNGIADPHDDRVVAWLLSHAAEVGASSVHLIEEASELHIRARVDNEMCDTLRLPISAGSILVEHTMLAAGLRPDEGAAQVGWFDSAHTGFGPRVRVAVAPTRAGRTLVVEGAARESSVVSLESLGLDAEALAGLRTAAGTRRGLIVVAGRDPSARSATLRAIVADGEFRDRSVATIEVPFGPPLDRAIQLKAPEGKDGPTSALRAALGLDVDVLLVAADGDKQVLAEAIEAALGDRVVLAGVDAPDVFSAITALCELEHPFVVAGALTFLVAPKVGGAFETLAISEPVRAVIIAGGGADAFERASRSETDGGGEERGRLPRRTAP